MDLVSSIRAAESTDLSAIPIQNQFRTWEYRLRLHFDSGLANILSGIILHRVGVTEPVRERA